MKKNLFILTLLATTIIFATACSPTANPAEAAPAHQAETAAADHPGPPVAVAPVEVGSISLLLNYSGNLQAQKEVHLVPKVAGEITQLLVQPGDTVKKGDAIAMIDDEVYALQLKQAQSVLDEAQLNLQKMQEGARPEEIAAARSALAITSAALTDAESIDDNERTAAALNLANARSALQLAQAEYDKIAWAGDVGTTPQALALETATLDYEAARANYEGILNGARPEEIEAAQAAVAAARSSLAQTEAGVNSAQAALDLVREGASAEEIAAAQAAVTRAEANLAQAEAGIGSARAASDLVLDGATPEEIAIAEASVAQAEANLTAAQTALDQAVLVAPFDGTVSEIHVREGEQVISGFPDEPVMTLGDLSTMRVETTDLRETDVGRIAVGQEVDITFDALPDTLLKGKVVYISPKASSEQGGVNYTTIIEFDELDPRLRWGMTAYVNITAD